MPILWSSSDEYRIEPYSNEQEIEQAVQETSGTLFGASRIYLNIKRKIGKTTKNIPDGYLVDLSSVKRPLLYVVEVERAVHDRSRHIAAQIVEFSVSFEAESQKVKSVIRSALDLNPTQREVCEVYAKENGFHNLDYLLEEIIYRGDFQALVIIDEIEEDLQTILTKRFKFGVEVLTLTRYINSSRNRIYQFEPFLADIPSATVSPVEKVTSGHEQEKVDPSEIDTIVVPARESGFQEIGLGENQWHYIRIHGSMIPKIKYLAVYRIKPTSAITHIAPVQSIEPYENSGKYIVYFAEPLQEIGPIKLSIDGKVKAPQNARYTSYDRLSKAKTLDEAFRKK